MKENIAMVWICEKKHEGWWLFGKSVHEMHMPKRTLWQIKKSWKKVVCQNLEEFGIVAKMAYDRKRWRSVVGADQISG